MKTRPGLANRRRCAQRRRTPAPTSLGAVRLPGVRRFSPSGAFTLVELLVVIAVIGILAALLLPVLSSTKRQAQGTQCLSQLRQLQQAWLMFTHDHEDSLPPNSDGPRAGKAAETPAWVAGWLRTEAEPGSKVDCTNVALLVGTRYAEFGSIGHYVQDPRIYRCPADKSRVSIDGQVFDRTRSMSMNAYMNGLGQWQSTNFITFRKTGDIPRPSEFWVFLDEREDSINDGYFATAMELTYGIVDYPASYHNGSGGLTFADGHAEYHRWIEPTTTPVLRPGQHLQMGYKSTSANDRDMAWLNAHTTLQR